jgi:hypothetical protein
MIWLEKNVHLALSNTHSNLIFASHVRSSFFEEILNTVSVLSVLRFTSSDYPFWKLPTFFFFLFQNSFSVQDICSFSLPVTTVYYWDNITRIWIWWLPWVYTLVSNNTYSMLELGGGNFHVVLEGLCSCDFDRIFKIQKYTFILLLFLHRNAQLSICLSSFTYLYFM